MTINRHRRPAAPVTAARSASQASPNSAAKATAFAPRMSRLALETRILFDGAGAAAGADALSDDPFFQDIAPQSQQDEQQPNPLFDGNGDYVVMGDGPSGASSNGQEGDGGTAVEAPINSGDDPQDDIDLAVAGDEAGTPVGEAVQDQLEESDNDGAVGDAVFAGFETFAIPMSQTEAGSISAVENTADDPVASVGEDDAPSAVLAHWKVSGEGQITVQVEGGVNGTLSHIGAGGLTCTGTADDVNTWLAGIRYQYKAADQKQDGHTDTLSLIFTTHDEGGVNQTFNEIQEILIAPQNDEPVVGTHGKTIARVPERDGDGKPGELGFAAPVATEDGLGFTHDLLGIFDPDNLSEQVIIKLETVPDATMVRWFLSVVVKPSPWRPALLFPWRNWPISGTSPRARRFRPMMVRAERYCKDSSSPLMMAQVAA